MIKKDKPEHTFIWESPNNLDKITCELLIEKADSDPERLPGITGNDEVDTSIKESTDSIIRPGEHWEGYLELLTSALTPAVRACEYLSGMPNIIDSGFQVQRTDTISEIGYDWHIDTLISVGPDGNLWERVLTYMWYLNDDFEEGWTEFNDCKIEPETGKLVMFVPSSTMIHKGHPPRNGSNKYICTGWLWTPLPLFNEETEPSDI